MPMCKYMVKERHFVRIDNQSTTVTQWWKRINKRNETNRNKSLGPNEKEPRGEKYTHTHLYIVMGQRAKKSANNPKKIPINISMMANECSNEQMTRSSAMRWQAISQHQFYQPLNYLLCLKFRAMIKFQRAIARKSKRTALREILSRLKWGIATYLLYIFFFFFFFFGFVALFGFKLQKQWRRRCQYEKRLESSKKKQKKRQWQQILKTNTFHKRQCALWCWHFNTCTLPA